MREATAQAAPAQLREDRIDGAPDVEQHRKVELDGDVELAGEDRRLAVAVEAGNEMVEADLADRDQAWIVGVARERVAQCRQVVVMLWAMLALPVVVALYVFLMQRRKKTSLRYANLALVKEALGSRSAWRRHVPPALLFLALAALLFASSRPAALVTLPSAQETIVLAIDVSGSMRAGFAYPRVPGQRRQAR